MSPTITLCADDYGLAPGVSRAIRELIEIGRLQATGCMTGSPHWPAEAPALKAFDGKVDVGLHITLTDQQPLAAMPGLAPSGRLPAVGTLIKRAMAGKLDRAELAAEINRQVDAFVSAFGRAPDFLDGHQHAHLLPVIREVVVDIWRDRLGGRGWVRSCWESPLALVARGTDPLRSTIITALGWRQDRLLTRTHVPHNLSFRGIYDLTERIPYDTLFASFTDRPGPRTLVMCHPGFVDAELAAVDRVTGRRETEFRFLASAACGRSLEDRGIRLARLMA